MAERVSIKEAAERLGVSQDTMRRRLKSGELAGEREKTPQGFVWRVELPQEPGSGDAAAAEPTVTTSAPLGDGVALAQLRERVAGLERLADELKGERDAWREQAQRDGEAARELRVLLHNEQMRALPVETTRQDGSEATGVLTHDAQAFERQATQEGTRRSLWDRLRRK